MKIHKSIGSKERFLEMFQGVNKLQINEVAANTVQNGSQLIDKTFEEFATKVAQVKQTNTQVVGEDNFVEIVTADNDGNQITFTFKVNSSEGDQDGVFHVDNAVLTKFKVVSQNLNVDWDENMKFVQEFNVNHAGEIANVVAEYADFETETTAVDDDEIYEDAVRLIDKVPYKKGTETMQTNKAYADQKPTNPDLRVHATELDKFVSEMEDYVNNADTEDEFALPNDNGKALPSDDDGSIGVDPYDQEVANDGNDDWKISGKKLAKPKKAPPYMEKTGSKERAVPSWAEDLMEDGDAVGEATDQDKYEDVVFMQGEEADEPLEILKTQGEDAAIQYLMQWHDSGNHMGSQELGHGSNDQTYEKDGYHMSWNFPLNYIGLAYELSGVNEDAEKGDYPDQMGKKFKPKNQFPKKKKKPQSVVKLSEEDTVDVEVGNELEGGLGDDASLSDFCPKQLAMGLEVEMEHTDDPKVALEIAMDHLTELPDYYTRLNDMEADAETNGAGSTDPMNPSGCLPQSVLPPMGDDDSEETDELLGYKPHNVNDYSNEEFDYVSAETEYSDREGYDDNVDHKDNDIPENFWTEFQALIDEFGEKVVNYLFNNGLRGYYETVAKENYSFDEVRRTLEMLKVPEVNEINVIDNNVDVNQADVGDRYRDAKGNNLVVNDEENNNGGVGLQSQEGEKEIATQDLQFLKKLNEEQIKTAKQVLKNRSFGSEMTKKEAVQILIEHNIK